MRKVVHILTVLLITSTVFAQPKLEFIGGNNKDWGKVMQDEGPLHTEIKIKNNGNKLLEIYGVKPGCGCTTAPIDKKLIDPGEIATVDVTLKIEKDSGPILKGIEFTTNDPKNDKVDYQMRANVKVPLELFPKFLNLGAININQEISGRIVLSNHTPSDIKITSVQISNPDLKTNITSGFILKSDSHNSVQATINSSTEGVLDEKIILKTDNKKYPLIEVPVRGMIGQQK